MRLYYALLILAIGISSCDKLSKFTGVSSEKNESSDSLVEKKYFSNGRLEYSFQLDSQKERHGNGYVYYETGKLKSAFKYDHGKKTWAASYYKNGNVSMEIPYKNNKKDGIRKKFYETGALESELPYKDDEFGVGLKEYTKSGKLKELPKLLVRGVDKTDESGGYIVEVYFDKNPERGTYYIGKLDNGFKTYKLERMINTGSKGILEMRIPPGTFLMEKMHFVGEYKTPMSNFHLAETSFNLVVER